MYARAWIDEAALDHNLEDNWNEAIQPTLIDLRGDAWFTSTPKGRDGFYRLWLNGEQGKPGWASWTMPTSSNPVIHPEEIQAAKADIPLAAFQQEYEAEFLADAANPFGLSFIAACVVDEMAEGPVVCWGVDFGKSQDWTVAIGLNAAGDVCAFQRWKSDWNNITHRVEAMIGQLPALVDQTGVGDVIVDRLARKCPRSQGYIFTNASKQILFEGLAVDIQRGDVHFPDGDLKRELDSFIFEFTPSGKVRYTAPQGCYDDCVDALGLARRCWSLMPAATRIDVGDVSRTPSGADWWAEHVENDDLWD